MLAYSQVKDMFDKEHVPILIVYIYIPIIKFYKLNDKLLGNYG